MSYLRGLEVLMLLSAVGSASCGGESERLTTRASGAAGAGASGGAGVAGTAGASSGAGGGGTAGASGIAAGCALPADLVCTSTHVPDGCSCNPALVSGEKDCASTAQLHCLCRMGESQMLCVPENVDWNYDDIACFCDTSAPPTPYDCPHTQQFSCAGLDPFLEGCSCDLDAPLSPADCEQGAVEYACVGHHPDVGCACVPTFR